MTEQEIWRPVDGCEDRYEVSNLGRVRSTAKNWRAGSLIMKTRKTATGYISVSLNIETRRGVSRFVHRLVAEAFSGKCPSDMECAHINGVRSDNRPSNLIWATRAENNSHKEIHGTVMRGERNGRAILTAETVLEIRRLRTIGLKWKDIGAKFGISKNHAIDCGTGRNWRHL